MNEEVPPFKNGEHNSESASTFDRVITPLMRKYLQVQVFKQLNKEVLKFCESPELQADRGLKMQLETKWEPAFNFTGKKKNNII